jgi:hypothetical protein
MEKKSVLSSQDADWATERPVEEENHGAVTRTDNKMATTAGPVYSEPVSPIQQQPSTTSEHEPMPSWAAQLFQKMDQQSQKMDQQSQNMAQQSQNMAQQSQKMDQRSQKTDQQFQSVAQQLQAQQSQTTAQFQEMEQRLQGKQDQLAAQLQAQQSQTMNQLMQIMDKRLLEQSEVNFQYRATIGQQLQEQQEGLKTLECEVDHRVGDIESVQRGHGEQLFQLGQRIVQCESEGIRTAANLEQEKQNWAASLESTLRNRCGETVCLASHGSDTNPQTFGCSSQMIIPSFDAKTDSWSAYRRKFELIADHCRMTEEQRLLNLLSRINNSASKVLLKFDEQRPLTYTALVAELDKAFGLSAERCRRELPGRKRLRGESLDHLASEIALLVDFGYSDASFELREAEKVRYFINALCEGNQRFFVLAANPASLEQALEIVRKYDLELSNTGSRTTQESKPPRNTPVARSFQPKRCHRCGLLGHIQRDCPQQGNERRPGEREVDQALL